MEYGPAKVVPGLPADPIVAGLPARPLAGLPAWAGPARQSFGGLLGEAYETWSPR